MSCSTVPGVAAAAVLSRIARAKAAGGAPAFDEVIELSLDARRAEVVAVAIEALSFMALRSPSLRDSVAGRRAIRLIVASLCGHSAHPDVIVAAARALCVFLLDVANANAIISAGADPLLQAALPRHLAHAGVVVALCGALTKIRAGDYYVVDDPDLGLLVTAIDVHASAPAVVKVIFRLLSNLASGSSGCAFIAAGVIPRLVNALHAYSLHEGVIQSAISCICWLLIGDCKADLDEVALAFLSADAVPPLLAALQAHAGNAEIIEHTCSALEQLATTSPECIAVILPAVSTIVGAASMHLADEDMADSVCDLLWTVCDEAHGSAFVQSGAIAFALSALAAHPSCDRLARSVCGIASECRGVECKAAIACGGGVALFVSVLSLPHGVAAEEAALALASQLDDDSGCISALIDAIPGCVVALDVSVNRPNVTKRVCDLLSDLTDADSRSVSAVIASGAVSRITAALRTRSDDLDTVVAILRVLVNIVTECDALDIREFVGAVVAACGAAIARHEACAEVSGYVCCLLACIAGFSAHSHALVLSAGAVSIARSSLLLHVDASWTSTQACWLLWDDGDGNAADVAVRGTAVAVVAALLRHADDPSVVTAASYALRTLAARSANIPDLNTAGAVEAMAAAALRHGASTSAGSAVRACVAAMSYDAHKIANCLMPECPEFATCICAHCLLAGYCSWDCQRAHKAMHLRDCVDVGAPPPGTRGTCMSASAAATSGANTASESSVNSDDTVAAVDASDDAVAAVDVCAAELLCAAADCSGPGKFYCGCCFSVRYCSRGCQKSHRSVHKVACRSTDAARAAATTPIDATADGTSAMPL